MWIIRPNMFRKEDNDTIGFENAFVVFPTLFQAVRDTLTYTEERKAGLIQSLSRTFTS